MLKSVKVKNKSRAHGIGNLPDPSNGAVGSAPPGYDCLPVRGELVSTGDKTVVEFLSGRAQLLGKMSGSAGRWR
jgi:hypothetical protein